MKIALLTHLSPSFPLLIADLIEGLNRTLGEKHELTKHYLSANANNKAVIEEVQKLALEGIDLVIAYTNINNLLAIQELLAQFQKKAILIDSNAQLAKTPVYNENFCWLSMQSIESAEFLAKSLISETEGSIAILSDFINSGYQMSFFFSDAFVQNDREIVYQYAAPANGLTPNHIDHVAAHLIHEKPSIIYINSFGKEGKQFISLINREDIQEKLPKTKWAINSQLFNEIEENSFSKNMLACTTYNKDVDSEFSTFYIEKTKRKPSLFSCIGYEAGIIANQLDKEHFFDFNSPRGEISWKKETNSYKAKQTLYGYDSDEKRMIHKKQVFYESKNSLEQNELDFGGWTNTYLCY